MTLGPNGAGLKTRMIGHPGEVSEGQETPIDKGTWRARARRERERIAIDHRLHCETLNRFLTASVPVGRRVVVFDPLADEVDLTLLVAAVPDAEARFAVTRTPETGRRLSLHPWGGPTEWHRYGYRQPIADAPVVPDGDVGAVLVPGLAFDRGGVRLGRGRGYYDRLLARLDTAVLRIGVTGGYVVDGPLPADDHDVAMTHLAIATEVMAVG